MLAPAVSDNLAARNGLKSRLRPASVPAKRSQPDDTKPDDSIPDEPDQQEESEESIRKAFVDALTANQRTVGALTDATIAAIEAGFDRDDCIAWGLEAGLSDGYVRSTVSRLFVELVGRVKRKGGGRKANKGAVALAKRVLSECKGDFAEAKKLLLAARRIVESLEREADKE